MIQECSSVTAAGLVADILQLMPATDRSGIDDQSQLQKLAEMFEMEQNTNLDRLLQHGNNVMDQMFANSACCFVTFDDSAPKSNTSQSNQDSEMPDVANTSDEIPADAPILVDNGNNVECILPNDEPFTYLQGLNSDNLMQFSQQSAINELILKEQLEIKPEMMLKEQLEIKPQNLDVLPTFEEHDIGGYKFKLNQSTKRKGRSSWIYSESLNKVYLKMNEIFSIDAVYTPKMPMQKLRLRVLMCFVKEVSEPVLRCQNHISKDPESHPKLRHSLLRSENPSVEYCGKADGKSINDRYSVLIPLGESVRPQNEKSIKQTIALKFTCQNSCIGRKETSLIFLLEGMNGEILSQRVLDVKICSCPKRDRALEERNIATTNKRKTDEDPFASQSKLRKQDSSTPGRVKPERSSSDLDENGDDCNTQKRFDAQRTPGGGYRLVMEFSSKDEMLDVINYSFKTVANNIIGKNKPSLASSNYRRLKRLYEKGRKL